MGAALDGDLFRVELVIAATANVHKVPLLTLNPKDFALVGDLVDARSP